MQVIGQESYLLAISCGQGAMTIQTSHRQTFDVRAETFWRDMCLSLAYQERMYREALGCRSVEVLEDCGDYEHGMKRRLRLTKALDGPAPVLKLFGSVTTFEEVSEFDPTTQCWSYQVTPARMAERVDARGSVRLVVHADAIEQISTDTLTCRLFGLGGVVEAFMARSTEQGYIDKAAFMQRYIAENQLR